jgi:long-chain acyl-CoA synthetase
MSLNLADCVALTAREHPDKTAIVFQNTRFSYGELGAAVRRVANILRSLGIAPGDRVAIQLPNTPHFPMIYFGILHAGGVVVALNPMLPRRELVHTLEDSGARALFVFADLLGPADGVFKDRATVTPDLEHLVVVEPTMAPGQPDVGASFMSLMMAADDCCEMVATQPEDLAVLLYTAATDGHTRAAALTHFSLFQNAETIIFRALRYFPEDVFLAVLPLFHGFGQTTMMNAPFMAGSSIVLMPRFDATAALEALVSEKVTVTAVVPTMLQFLLAANKKGDFDLSHMRCVVTGGSAMNLELAQQFQDVFKVPVLEGYGLTETSPVVSFNCDAETNRAGSVGLPIWGVEVGILGDDDRLVGPTEVGEIVIRGHNVMRGYFNDPQANARVFHNGWFRTGDYGYLDADGYIFIAGLKKDMILRAGMNVYAREVELILEECSPVAAAAVVGVPDRTRGEEVRAFVQLRAGCEGDDRELLAYCRECLPSYKVPRKIEFVDELPRRADGAPDKAALRSGCA